MLIRNLVPFPTLHAYSIPARLLIFWKIFALHVYFILHAYSFSDFLQPARLFHTARLFDTQE